MSRYRNLGGSGAEGSRTIRGNTLTKMKKLRPDYPDEFMFSSLEQINEYFDSDKLLCLICGEHHKGLGVHVKSKHLLSRKEYNQKFGIPVTRKLLGVSSRLILSNQALLRGPERILALQPEASKKANKTKRSAHCQAHINHLLKLNEEKHRAYVEKMRGEQ